MTRRQIKAIVQAGTLRADTPLFELTIYETIDKSQIDLQVYAEAFKAVPSDSLDESESGR